MNNYPNDHREQNENQNTYPNREQGQFGTPQPHESSPTAQSWSNTGTGWIVGGQGQPNGYSPYGQPYASYAAPVSAPKKAKREKKGGIGAGAVALLLVACLLLGAGAGIGGAYFVLQTNEPVDTSPLSDGADRIDETTEKTPWSSEHETATFEKSEGTQVVVERVGIGSAEGASMSIAEVVEKVKHSVVEITTETAVRGSYFSQYVTSGAGSGVIIAKEGYVITNHHVIDGADTIVVRTTDGKEYTARLIGSDAASDVAIIKIDPAENALTVATLGDSAKLMVGEDAIAIGNPLGSLGGTVTNGIISALDREITVQGESMRLLQTNAAVNPGNSGGGLFNLAGELIGIVNAKSSGEDVEGLGFAIPINTAEEVAAQLIEFGYVRGRVDIGLKLIDITSIFDLMAYNLSSPGVYVYESPYNDQIKSGDRIQSVNGVAVTSAAEVKAAYRDCAVGDVIPVSIVRGNRVVEVKVTLIELVPTSNGVQFGD